MSILCWMSGLALLVATPADPITAIQTRFRYVEASTSLVTSKKDLAGLSLEGGTLTIWREGQRIAKLDAHLFGEMWQGHETFYFDERDQLVFVFKVTTKYVQPFELKGASVEEERLYFEGGKLIRWIEAKGAKKTAANDERSAAVAAEFMERARRYHAFAQSAHVALEEVPAPR